MPAQSTYPPGVEFEEIPCPVDGSTDYAVVVEACDIIYNVPGDFRVVKCSRCGLMRTSPRPTIKTMGVYYPDEYQPYESTKISNSTTTTHPIKRILKRLINYNTSRIPALPAGAMLEIGSASGIYLNQMAQKGWSVEGIEPSPQASAAAQASGFKVHTGMVETAPEREPVYDLIVGWMVLEHLHEPVDALKKLRRWSKPKSWAVFSVPNAGALEFRIFGKSWYALQVPTHTFHYTPRTIAQVLAQGGWRLESVHHQRILTNFFSSLGYWLEDRGWNNKVTKFLIQFYKVPWSVHRLLYPIAWFFGLFGQTGRMTVWATRIDD